MTQFLKWPKDLNKHFTKEYIWMAKSTWTDAQSLLIRERQIKTKMSYHLKPVRMAIIWKKRKKEKETNKKITTVGENVEKLEPLCTIGGNVKWCSCYGKQYSVPQKIKNRAII